MRVLVVDDHSLFREGITGLLEADGFIVVGQASNGKDAVEAALRLRPELVLMDISMAEMSGLEAMRSIKAKLPQTRVVMLTVSEENDDLVNALKGGADGYLLKSHSAEEFIASLHHLDDGEMAISRHLTSRAIKVLAEEIKPDRRPETTLSQRELDLLTLVSQGFTNKEIALRLSLSENTIKYYMKGLMARFNAQNRAEVVTRAIRAGCFILPKR